MKKLKYTSIIEQDLSRYHSNRLDTSTLREIYLHNVVSSISVIEKLLHTEGFNQMFIERSPFSRSCYFTFNKMDGKKCIYSFTVRISDHEDPNGVQGHIADYIDSRWGHFTITKEHLELLIENYEE